jgi:large subunit ribosomal protein L1
LGLRRTDHVESAAIKLDFDKGKIAARLDAPPLNERVKLEAGACDSARSQALELHRKMQRNRSKRYRAAAQQVDRAKAYNLAEAVSTLKKFSPTKFDQTVTVSFRLGVDPKQSDQMVRGTCPLPHGSGKKVRVLVFAEGEAAQAASEAGAEFVGMKDLIQKCQEGFQDFDVAIATPAAMAEVRKLGKVLGPRGLMPNPRTGTVTDDTAKAVQEVKAGRVEFKLDKNGNVAVPVGRFSFEENALVENGNAVIEAVVRARPASAKGRYLEGVTISATMSPGVRVDPAPYLNV